MVTSTILQRRRLFAVIAACTLSLYGLMAVTNATPAHAATTTYAADSSIFANPERGFHHRVDILALTASDVAAARSTNSISLLHSYLRLDAFRTSNIDSATLSGLSNALGIARAGGAKVVLRVSYNFGPYPNSEPDATESWIATHLSQLAPVLAANADVIAYMEAGFIGAWGEWHTSTNGYDTDPAAKTRILKNILAAVPASIQVALRYPSDVRLMQTNLTAAEFDRIGNHQDCYGASDPGDFGTWSRDGNTPDADKALIAAVGVNHFVGGETCNANSPRADCATALKEMPAMHFTELNIDYEPTVIQTYRNQGCFDTMQHNFGYRLALTTATYPTTVSAGGPMALSFGLNNSGWASVINPRPVFAVLDGPGGRFDIALSADPRTWESGQSPTINQTITVPGNVAAGTYRLALWLPDRATGLRNDPRYSIRLANTGTWDAATGLNVLATNIVVGSSSGDTTAPSVPTNFRVTGTTATSVSLAWNASTDNVGVAGYEVLRGGAVIGSVGGTTTTFTESNLNAGTYTYTVRAFDAAGNRSAPSTAVSATVTGGGTTGGTVSREAEASTNTLAGGAVVAACSTCSGGSKVGYIGNNTGTLTLNGVDGGTGGSSTVTISYLSAVVRSLQISVNGGTASTLTLASTGGWTTVGTVTTTVTLPAGSNNTIRLSNASGWAPDIDRLSWVVPGGGGTGGDTSPPSIPANFRVTGTTNTSVSLAWNASTDNVGVSGYQILRGGQVVASTGAVTSYTDSGLAAGTYSYQIRAFDAAGNNSALSSSLAATVSGGTPTVLLDNFDGAPPWTEHLNDLGNWTGANSFVNAEGVVTNGALVLQYNNQGWFGSDVNVDLSSKTDMVVRIRGNAGGEQSHFDLGIGGVTKRFNQYTSTAITPAFQDIRIPLAANGINKAAPGQLTMTFWHGSSGTVYIDEIRFE